LLARSLADSFAERGTRTPCLRSCVRTPNAVVSTTASE
jgi:hypothetical protein